MSKKNRNVIATKTAQVLGLPESVVRLDLGLLTETRKFETLDEMLGEYNSRIGENEVQTWTKRYLLRREHKRHWKAALTALSTAAEAKAFFGRYQACGLPEDALRVWDCLATKQVREATSEQELRTALEVCARERLAWKLAHSKLNKLLWSNVKDEESVIILTKTWHRMSPSPERRTLEALILRNCRSLSDIRYVNKEVAAPGRLFWVNEIIRRTAQIIASESV
jgi:DNA topoisomerase VI subunit B